MVFRIFIALLLFPFLASAAEQDSALHEGNSALEYELLMNELELELSFEQGRGSIILCEFTCIEPIRKCDWWSPGASSYLTEFSSSASDSAVAIICRAKAESTCKRCTGRGASHSWFERYSSVKVTHE